VNGDDEQIGAALRGIAEQAAPPRLDADAVWRAGRRRRWAALTASAGSVAAAAALVPVILLGALTGPAQPAKLKQTWPQAARPHPAVEFGQLARVVHKPCLPGSRGLPGTSRHACYYLTGDRMTARIQSARVAKVGSGPNGFEINASLMPASWPRFKELTAGLEHQPSPRDRMAIIAHGVVLLSPKIIGALDGSFQLWTASGTQASTMHLLHWLEGH
jgi:hypothetical protein